MKFWRNYKFHTFYLCTLKKFWYWCTFNSCSLFQTESQISVKELQLFWKMNFFPGILERFKPLTRTSYIVEQLLVEHLTRPVWENHFNLIVSRNFFWGITTVFWIWKYLSLKFLGPKIVIKSPYLLIYWPVYKIHVVLFTVLGDPLKK